jgi:DNA-binding CsgD family transcriptional regulator
MGSVPLIGRDHELRVATDLLDGVVAGRPHVLLLDGPPGSGRARLGHEIAAVARHRGITVPPLPVDERAWDAIDMLARFVAVLVIVPDLRLHRLTHPVIHRLPVPPRPDRAGPPDRVDLSVLSPREREVAELAGQAMTNVQIAHRVGRSPHTVNYHLRQIFQKLGIASRVELAALLEQRREPPGTFRSLS